MRYFMNLFARGLLLAAVACASLAAARAADAQADNTRKWVAVLQQPEASFYARARACQQLGEAGGPEAVPVLAALLADEHLSAYARGGLEGISGPAAAEALRQAVPALKGDRLAGVVNSLGVVRDAKSVGLLIALVNDPASGVAGEALSALGRIANDESIQVLRATLAKGPEPLRAQAAAACLIAAEKRLADGQAEQAIALYDAVRQSSLPPQFRAGATRGAILARKENGVPLLVEQLKSSDAALRNVALLTLREIPSDALASALNAAAQAATGELKNLILLALADCHNAQSLKVLADQSAQSDPAARKIALTALDRIGGPAETGVFLATVAANRSEEESAIALNALGRLPGAAVDERIARALAVATESGARIKLIHLVESRGMTNATVALLQMAAEPEVKVSVAALRALKSVAGRAELPALISLVKLCKAEDQRDAAENAVAGVVMRTSPKTLAGGEVVLAEFKQAADAEVKNSWARILIALGYPPALPDLRAALDDTREQFAASLATQLGHWPDPAPVEGLFEVARKSQRASLRRRALTSAIQLATAAAEEHQRPEETLAGWFQEAGRVAESVEERRLIISGLGRVKQAASFRLLAPYLNDPSLQTEAAIALLQIAPAAQAVEPEAWLAALERIAATANNAELRGQAAKLAAAIPRPPGLRPLFDGRTLAGWEGNSNVWRVRDGVVVGGSMAGNARNEFLATLRSYTNFVLRLEYKLIGAEGFVNGGVQFRSERLKQPENEMRGFQADIGAGYSGALYDESRRNRFLAQPPAEQIKRLEKPGDWNRYEVRCVGRRAQIRLNGELTVDYSEDDVTLPQSGLIGLQIHGGCQAEISFRNLTLETLP